VPATLSGTPHAENPKYLTIGPRHCYPLIYNGWTTNTIGPSVYSHHSIFYRNTYGNGRLSAFKLDYTLTLIKIEWTVESPERSKAHSTLSSPKRKHPLSESTFALKKTCKTSSGSSAMEFVDISCATSAGKATPANLSTSKIISKQTTRPNSAKTTANEGSANTKISARMPTEKESYRGRTEVEMEDILVDHLPSLDRRLYSSNDHS